MTSAPLTIPEVAALLGRTPRTIQRWIADGRLPCTTITRNSRYITRQQLEDAGLVPVGKSLGYERPEHLRIGL